MADTNLKQAFIEAVRTTPEGIADFLATPIPEPPTCATPADVDGAIIANGLCATYILDLFRPFAGLTPIELFLRIGQHNNVLEAGLLAGLAYIGETSGPNAQNDLQIIDPVAGQTYAPGNVRLQAKAKNGDLNQVAVERDGESAPVALERDDNGTFWGFMRIDTAGAYTLTFNGLFANDATQAATVDITLSSDPTAETADPEGGDFWPVETAKTAFDQAYAKAVKALSSQDAMLDTIIEGAVAAANRVKDVIASNVSTAVKGISAIAGAAKAILDKLVNGRGVDDTPATTDDDLLYALADLKTATETAYSAATTEYFTQNEHPAGGYVSCPETLAGAAAAMNEKYGAGSVSY